MELANEESNDSDSDQTPQNLCDDSDDDLPLSVFIKAVKRNIRGKIKAEDNCVICGEFGRNNELWFRCTACGYWAHELCSGVKSAAGYKCDFCIAN